MFPSINRNQCSASMKDLFTLFLDFLFRKVHQKLSDSWKISSKFKQRCNIQIITN